MTSQSKAPGHYQSYMGAQGIVTNLLPRFAEEEIQHANIQHETHSYNQIDAFMGAPSRIINPAYSQA